MSKSTSNAKKKVKAPFTQRTKTLTILAMTFVSGAFAGLFTRKKGRKTTAEEENLTRPNELV